MRWETRTLGLLRALKQHLVHEGQVHVGWCSLPCVPTPRIIIIYITRRSHTWAVYHAKHFKTLNSFYFFYHPWHETCIGRDPQPPKISHQVTITDFLCWPLPMFLQSPVNLRSPCSYVPYQCFSSKQGHVHSSVEVLLALVWGIEVWSPAILCFCGPISVDHQIRSPVRSGVSVLQFFSCCFVLLSSDVNARMRCANSRLPALLFACIATCLIHLQV